jgi:hypothetical protein
MSVKDARISILKLLEQKKAAILRRWTGLVFDTYPHDTAMILKSEGDRFANPVGYCVQHNLAMVLDGLISGDKVETLFPNLEEIIKVRAVQNFTPEAAVSFMHLLTKAISSEVGSYNKHGKPDPEMKGLEERIDLLSNACSVIYADCRLRIDRIKASEQTKAAINMSRMLGTWEREK